MKILMLLFSLFILTIEISHAQTTEEISKKASYTIIGRFEGIDSGLALLYNPYIKKLDSAFIWRGRFEFKGHADTPQFLLLRITKKDHKDFKLGFLAENRQMNISGNIDDADNVVITGSSTQNEYKSFSKKFKSYAEEETRLVELNDSLDAKRDKKDADSIRKVMVSFRAKEQAFIKDYAKHHPSSYISAQQVCYYFIDNPIVPELETIYNVFTPAVQNSYYGKKIKDALETARTTALGKIAPDFTQNDILGNPITLSSYRGRYVLIEFWASWCAPCRVENPNIVEAYSKFHSKGFYILGVSMDDKRDKWEEAIKKDNLSWSQVSDLKEWQNSVRVLYGVEDIPTNFLVDKDGKIIARALRGDDLMKKLHELFK
jgi:peroxiredoxin